MEDNVSEKWTKTEIVKLVGIIVILAAILLYSVFSGNNFSKKEIEQKNHSNPVTLFAPIEDNYKLEIKKSLLDKDETIEYINDGKLQLYNVIDSQEGYLIYKGKTYVVNPKGNTIKEVKKQPDYINDNYANIEFIKLLAKKCDVSDIKTYTLDCSMSIRDYIEEYNVYYGKNFIYEGEDKIVFHFRHGNIMSGIKVDYSLVNEIIKNGDYTTYDIRIENVNSNDYSNLLNVFKDTLK